MKPDEQGPDGYHEGERAQQRRGRVPLTRALREQKRRHHDVEQRHLVRGIHDEHVQEPQIPRGLRRVERHERHGKHEQLVHQDEAAVPNALHDEQGDKPRSDDAAPDGHLDERRHDGIALQPHPRRLRRDHRAPAQKRQRDQADRDDAVFQSRAGEAGKRLIELVVRPTFAHQRPVQHEQPAGRHRQRSQQHARHLAREQRENHGQQPGQQAGGRECAGGATRAQRHEPLAPEDQQQPRRHPVQHERGQRQAVVGQGGIQKKPGSRRRQEGDRNPHRAKVAHAQRAAHPVQNDDGQHRRSLDGVRKRREHGKAHEPATGMRWTSSTMSAHANPTTAQPIPGVRAKRERIEPIRPLPPCLRLYQKTRMRCLPACNFIPFVGGKTRPRLVASNKLGCRPRAAHPSHAAQSPHPSAHEHQGKEREQWN